MRGRKPRQADFQIAPLLLLLRVNAAAKLAAAVGFAETVAVTPGVIGLFITGYLVLSFWLFYQALWFVARFPGLGAVLTERLMYILFAFLFGLLLLSNLVISYTNLFRNRETAFLLALPIPTQTIFRWKFIESTLLASWAFLFLIAPLVAAFGLVRSVPWHFYLVTPLLIALFIVLPGVAGAWLAILVGRFLDRRSFQIAPRGDRPGSARAGRVLVEGATGHQRAARRTHARSARSIARPDPFHDVSVPAQLLVVGRGVAMGGRHPARREFFRPGALEPHAVLRQPGLHAVWPDFLRHRLGGPKPGTGRGRVASIPRPA